MREDRCKTQVISGICRLRLNSIADAVTDFNKRRYFYSNTNEPSACGEGKHI